MPDSQKPPAIPPSRKNKRAFTVWLADDVIHQISIIAAETRQTREELLREELNSLFKKHGKPEIA